MENLHFCCSNPGEVVTSASNGKVYTFSCLLGSPQTPRTDKSVPSSADASMLFFVQPVQGTLHTFPDRLPPLHLFSRFPVLLILRFLSIGHCRQSGIQVLQLRHSLWLIFFKCLLSSEMELDLCTVFFQIFIRSAPALIFRENVSGSPVVQDTL